MAKYIKERYTTVCEHPIFAVRKKVYSKKPLYFLNNREQWAIHGNVFYDYKFNVDGTTPGEGKEYPVIKVPCGKCLPCLRAQRDEWTLRCWLEVRRYEFNHFITLTYETPPMMGVEKAEITRFVKNVREHFRRKLGHTGIKYLACGEYGAEEYRPHYHIILINCPPFGDEKFYKKGKHGHSLYTSEILNHMWGKGYCVIGSATFNSIRYVASSKVKEYQILKLKQRKKPLKLKQRKKPYCEQNPVFIKASTNKGLGYDYFMENCNELLNTNVLKFPNDRTFQMPRYFKKKIKLMLRTLDGEDIYSTNESDELEDEDLDDWEDFEKDDDDYE